MKLISKIWTKLSLISTFYYGMFYLALIPLYAFTYYILPNQFYQSTAKVERLNNVFDTKPEIEDEIAFEIEQAMEQTFKTINKCDYIITNRADTFYNPIETGLVDNEGISVRDDFISIPVLIRLSKESSVYLPLKFEINGTSDNHLSKNIVDRRIFLDTLSTSYNKEALEPSYLGYNFRDLFSKKSNYIKPQNQQMHLFIDRKLQAKINSLSFGLNGVSAKNDYWNMFYLSAVTITTLGFGDFVPITKTARLWVSSEAILGVIIIGLFLNSLTKNISKPN